MTEIVERLERQAVNVENDGHVSAARAMREAATTLTEARAEIEALKGMLFDMEQLKNTYRNDCLLAESELSTLRARVREVVGPIADQADKYDPDEGDSHEHAWGRLDLTIGDLRAARQLMEEVK